MIPDWIINLVADIFFWIGIPALLIFSVTLPFLVIKKVLKHRFTFLNILASIIIAIGLLALDFYGLYWGLAYLQGYAACSLYGC